MASSVESNIFTVFYRKGRYCYITRDKAESTDNDKLGSGNIFMEPLQYYKKNSCRTSYQTGYAKFEWSCMDRQKN